MSKGTLATTAALIAGLGLSVAPIRSMPRLRAAAIWRWPLLPDQHAKHRRRIPSRVTLFSSITEMGRNATRLGEGRSVMIFAAKTTASGLIALLVAFTFNLDQPQWALLTVFIVAQPQSGLVLAKSFYRIIGTLVGAAVALLFVALFAQERVLFLGAPSRPPARRPTSPVRLISGDGFALGLSLAAIECSLSENRPCNFRVIAVADPVVDPRV
jgi:hypothetical protein